MQIPFYETEPIIERARAFPQLDEIRLAAEAILHAPVSHILHLNNLEWEEWED